MFRPLTVANLREVFFEGYITSNVKKILHTQNVKFYKFIYLCILFGFVTHNEISVHSHESLKIQIHILSSIFNNIQQPVHLFRLLHPVQQY